MDELRNFLYQIYKLGQIDQTSYTFNQYWEELLKSNELETLINLINDDYREFAATVS